MWLTLSKGHHYKIKIKNIRQLIRINTNYNSELITIKMK